MRLSLQTVIIVFGVTLAHLCIITALSPSGSEGSLGVPAGPTDTDYHGPVDGRHIPPDNLSANPPIAPPGDVPAQPRLSSETSTIDGDLPALPPRQFSPLPQS